VKKAVFKADPNRGGFIRSTLAPVNERRQPGFGVWDAIEVVLLVAALLLAMRFFLAR